MTRPIILMTFSALMVILPTAPAEVKLDGTMGPGVLNGPNYDIGAEFGQQHDGNLFHSFEVFNLSSSESATFSGPTSVENIISRVTGKDNPSNIDGTLRSTIPNANLYFLNPYGIAFGPNARLDVQGSFHASTADTLRLKDGGQFNARYPSDSVLTVAPIQAFGFLSGSPAELSVTGSELSVNAGNTLSFIGGDLSIKNAAKLSAPAGQIDLVGVGSEGDAKLSNGFLDLSSFSQLADIYIENSLVDASTKDTDGKGINVRANNLTLDDGRLVAETYGAGKGGDITIDVAGLVELLGEAVSDPSMTLETLISTRTQKQATGSGGNIELTADQLHITDGRSIGSLTRGKGDGGQITLNVTNLILEGMIEIEIPTPEGMMKIKNPSTIVAQAEGEGNAGKVVLHADGKITLKDGTIINTSSIGSGNSGDIELVARELEITGGSQTATSTMGSGSGGDIHAKVAGSIIISGTGFGQGESSGGGILVSAIPYNPISGQVVNQLGNAGNIVLEADELVIKDYQYNRVTASTYGLGKGGNVTITARNLHLADGGTISARSISSPPPGSEEYKGKLGDAGNITLNVTDSLRMQTGSSIGTNAERSGGGQIKITFQGDRLHLSDSEISSSVQEGEGGGGDMNISADLILLDESQITARAYQGRGGNITIDAGLVKTPNSVIDASSERWIDGEVLITGKEENFEELLRLREDFLGVDDQLKTPCDQRNRQSLTSTLGTVKHFYTRPMAPDDLNTHAISITGGTSTHSEAKGAAIGTALRTEFVGLPCRK
jgi:filamentous hemagglutinin family protein